MDYEAGLCGPLPEWARVASAARFFRAAPWDLLAQDDWQFWTEAGLLLKGIEAEASERARKK